MAILFYGWSMTSRTAWKIAELQVKNEEKDFMIDWLIKQICKHAGSNFDYWEKQAKREFVKSMSLKMFTNENGWTIINNKDVV